jgi:hypothetical protein
MKRASAEANEILSKIGITFPLASEPYALSYKTSFGDPVNCGTKKGDDLGQKVLEALYRDNDKYAERCLKGPPAINVFCVWAIKFADPAKPPDGVTLNYRTILLCNRTGRLGLALAHELGHALLGAYHSQSPGNLMFGDLREASGEVSDIQTKRMHSSYAFRTGGGVGWQWKEPT